MEDGRKQIHHKHFDSSFAEALTSSQRQAPADADQGTKTKYTQACQTVSGILEGRPRQKASSPHHLRTLAVLVTQVGDSFAAFSHPGLLPALLAILYFFSIPDLFRQGVPLR